MTLRRSGEAWVRRWWAGRAGLPGALLSVGTIPLELLYRSLVQARGAGHTAGLLRPAVARIPVVSVGNLVVGGTGKTPLSAWVVRTLLAAGRRPALVARGYGEDELRLHERWNPEAPVVADPVRSRAVQRAAGLGADVAVLDDGFQHRALARDLDVVAISAEQPFPGRMLPRGPYREPAGALGRADAVVITRRTADDGTVQALERRLRRFLRADALVALARLAPDGWTDLAGRAAAAPAGPVVAVTGVASPDGFADLVRRETGGPAELLSFPDHHAFGPSDVREISGRGRGRTVAVTEKDAVKLGAFTAELPDVRVLRLEVRLERGGEALRERILEVAGGAGGAGRKGR